MKSYSVRKRLVLGTWLLLALALAPPYFFFANSLRNDLLEETKQRATESLGIAEWFLQRHGPFDTHKDLTVWAVEFEKRTGIRFTYIVNGRVVADSDVPFERLAELDNHIARPEVRTALFNQVGMEVRYSTTLKKDLIYAARKVEGSAPLPEGIIRVAIPVSLVQARLHRLEANILGAFVFSLMASGVLGLLVTRPLLRSIETLSRAAQDIGEGNYARRIRNIPGKELQPLAQSINGMAHNIEQHLKQLEEQKGRLEAVFDGMREGVMVLDEEGRVHSCNRALAAFFEGVERKAGCSPLEATLLPALQEEVDKLRNASGPGDATIQMDLPDGRAVEAHIVPFRDDTGRRMVIVFHDISEREQLERIRRDFVANVSHELKTPLTSIKGYAETLLESPPSSREQMGMFLRTILRNANHMTKMVNSLLVLARSEHKGEKVGHHRVDASEVLRQCVREMEPVAGQKHINIENGVEDGTVVMADRDGLAEVFRNLLDNAIKYSPTETTITVTSRTIEGKRAFCFRDQGPGIPRQSRDRIFERFYRIEREGDSNKNGSAGLGLAICRRIIKSHGGEIWVESPLDNVTGAGAAFFVTLKEADALEDGAS